MSGESIRPGLSGPLDRPLQTLRSVFGYAKARQALYLSYHFSPDGGPLSQSARHFVVSRNGVDFSGVADDELRGVINRTYDFALSVARVTSFSEIYQMGSRLEPEMSARMFGAVSGAGVADEIIVPVFGQGGAAACVCYGFGVDIESLPSATCIDLEMASGLLHNRLVRAAQSRRADQATLSPRECEILGWMARGKSRRDIASILGLSDATIDTYTRRIYAKLKVHDRISAILLATSRGWLRT